MKVLHIQPQGEFGGAGRMTVDWIRHSHVHNVVVVGGGGPLAAMLERQGCKVYSVPPWRPRNVWSLLPKIAAVVEREEIDLIHSCNCDGHLLGGLLRLKTGRPEIWFNHGPMERIAWSRFARFIPSDALLVPSRGTEREQRKHGFFAKSLAVHRLGIDCGAFKTDGVARNATRAALGLSDEICLAMVARFEPGKGQLLLVEALAGIRRRRPDLRFKIFFIGGMLQSKEALDYQRETKAGVVALGLTPLTVFTGHVDNVSDYLNAADVFVMASIVPESFGLSLVEAMALEKIAVAPDEGGPAEIVSDGEDGFLFPPRDAIALSHRLETLLDDFKRDPGRFGRIGKATRRKVETHYDVAVSARELEKIYERVVAARGAIARSAAAMRESSR